MKDTQVYDVLYIGNYTKDTIISPAGTKYNDGGAINFAAHAAARLGYKTAVVTRLAQEDAQVVEKMTENGIDCFVTYSPTSTCIRLEYPTSDPDIRNLSVASTAGSISGQDVQSIKAKSAVIGASLRGEVDQDVIEALKAQNMRVAADVQGYVRVLRDQNLVYEPWPEMPAVLAQVDVLKSDAVEAEFLTGEQDIHKAAQIYAQMGPKEIVLTHRDGVLIYADNQFYEAGFYPENLIGRSGRGDTCVGTYMAMRLSKPPAEAGIWAAAVTSLKMEHPGPFNRSMADVEDLIHRKYRNGSNGNGHNGNGHNGRK